MRFRSENIILLKYEVRKVDCIANIANLKTGGHLSFARSAPTALKRNFSKVL